MKPILFLVLVLLTSSLWVVESYGDSCHDSVSIDKFRIIHYKGSGPEEVGSGYAQTNLAIEFALEWNTDKHSSGHDVTVEIDYGDGSTGSSLSHAYSNANAGTRNVSATIRCDLDGDIKSDDSGGLTIHVISSIEIAKVGGDAVGNANRMSFNNRNTAEGKVLPVGTPGSNLIDWNTSVNAKFLKSLNAASATLALPEADWPDFNSLWGGGHNVYASIDADWSSAGSDGYDETGELLQGRTAYLSSNAGYSAFYDASGTEKDGADPNWYYYWSRALGVENNHTYDGSQPTSTTLVSNMGVVTMKIASNARWPGQAGNGPTGERYINGFWASNLHENWHRDHRLHNINTHGGWAIQDQAASDVDGDDICDHDPGGPAGHNGGFEAMIGSNPNVPDSTEVGANWAESQGLYSHGVKDWSHPGIQWE